MSKIIDRTGKGAAISQAENDSNLESLHGVNQGVALASHTVDITDQGDTIEFSSGGAVAVTLDSIVTILGLAHTADFKVTLVAIGTGTVVTITPNALDTINTGASTIVLTENEYVTIQTDSTSAIWNIIESSNALKLGGIAASSFLRSDAADTATGNIIFAGDNAFTGQNDFDKDGIEIASASVTTTAAELNVLDGITSVTSELNDVDRSVNVLADFPAAPEIYGATTAGTPTYVTQVGKYYRVGNLVYVNIQIIISNLGGMAGVVRIKNLPFNSAHIHYFALGKYQGFTGLSDAQHIAPNIQNSTAFFQKITKNLNLGITEINATDLTATTHIEFTTVYTTNDA